jgi:hypothetical protein
VVTLAELPLVLIELIEHVDQRTALGRNALAALESQRGATEKTIRALAELINKPEANAHCAGRGAL